MQRTIFLVCIKCITGQICTGWKPQLFILDLPTKPWKLRICAIAMHGSTRFHHWLQNFHEGQTTLTHLIGMAKLLNVTPLSWRKGQKVPIIFGREDIKHWHCDWKLINKSSPDVKPKQMCHVPLCLAHSSVEYYLFYVWAFSLQRRQNSENHQCIFLLSGSSNDCVN